MSIMDASGTASPGNVKDSTDQTFMVDVIEASKDQPVLVDFWAPWCGPCKTLGPIIERAVDEHAGKVKLVKINIDENPGVAGQLGVRSIPAVFAFNGGQPVDGFMGALPEGQVKQFIEKILGGTDGAKAIDEALDQAEAAAQSGDIGTAAQIYAAIVNEEPQNVRAIAGLARCYLSNGDQERAQMTLDMIPQDKRDDPVVKSVVLAMELTAEAPAADEFADRIAAVDANPSDHEARFALAEALIAAGRNEDGVDHLLTILQTKMDWSEGKAKEKLLQVFEAAGPTDPVTVDGRRRLASLMFA